jgi:2,4-dienoyl-CoA reductase (NADPH2)
LFTPFQLGSHTLKNRLVALPVFSGYALPDGRVSDLLIEHYAALADSGVAMVVVANAAVSADGAVAVNNLRADRDDYLPGLTRLAWTIRERGALAVLQLNHGGRFAKTLQPLSPSAIDSAHMPFNIASLKDFMNFFPLEERFGLTRDFMQRLTTWDRPLTIVDRQRVIQDFGGAAGRACAAGFEAIELHGATGYLLTQFLSGFSHKDPAGAPMDFETRLRFALEVVREVRRRLPAGVMLGWRLLLREWVPDGIGLEEALSLAVRLEVEGVNYFSPSVGTYHSMFTSEARSFMAPPAYLRQDTLALKQRLRTPVIVSGRVLTPALAGELLSEGAGDLVGLGRVLRADPAWVRKARSGAAVRPCRNCNLCLRRVVLDQGFFCTRWPHLTQSRTDFEQRFLKRDLDRNLWVLAGAADLDVLQTPMAAAMLPARPTAVTTVLFLRTGGRPPGFEERIPGFIEWVAAERRRRGLAESALVRKIVETEDSPDEAVGVELEQGGYGSVLLARNPDEPWRERFLYRHRAKAVSLVGSHPLWPYVLVFLDLSLTSLFVLRNLEQSLMRNPAFHLDFIHVLQGKEATARRRWTEMQKILGWDKPAELGFLPMTSNAAESILREIRQRDCGTVVLGKRGLSRIKRLFLGSVSAAVLHGLSDRTLVLID